MKKERNEMTQHCYPNEVDVHKFLAEIEISIETFRQNMQSLGIANEKKYIEEWMDKYTDWMEMR